MAENFAPVEAEFRQALTDCRGLYHRAAMQCCECRPAELGDSPERLLTVLEPEDIDLPGVPPELLAQALDPAQRFLVSCPGCQGRSHVPASFLGRAAKCKTCQHRFVAAWGELVEYKQ